MAKRRYLLRGVYVACGTVLCVAIAVLVQIGFSYDGKCGGFLPALAGPRCEVSGRCPLDPTGRS